MNLHNWRAREWKPAIRAAGINPPRRIYDLRHTYATMSLAAGVSLFSLARRMGTSVEMIDRTYGHLAPTPRNMSVVCSTPMTQEPRRWGSYRALMAETREGVGVQKPCSGAKADARTRTGDPFITRERQVRDARPLAGTRGHVLAGNQALSRPSGWTRVPARARADVPVLYPLCARAGCRRPTAHVRATRGRATQRVRRPSCPLRREAVVSRCTPARRPEEACRERRRDASIRRQAGLLGQHARCWRDEEPALTAACRAQARVAAVRREPTSSSIALAAALAPPAAR